MEEAAFLAYSTTWKKFLSRKHRTVDKGNFRRGWKGENEEHKERGGGLEHLVKGLEKTVR